MFGLWQLKSVCILFWLAAAFLVPIPPSAQWPRQGDSLPSRPSSSVCGHWWPGSMGKQPTLSPMARYILSIISGEPLKMWDCPVPEFRLVSLSGSENSGKLPLGCILEGGGTLLLSLLALPAQAAPVHCFHWAASTRQCCGWWRRGWIILPGCFGSPIISVHSGCSCGYVKPLV